LDCGSYSWVFTMKIAFFILIFAIFATAFNIDGSTRVYIQKDAKDAKNSFLELKKYIHMISGVSLEKITKKTVKNSKIIIITKESKLVKKLPYLKKLQNLKDDSFIIDIRDNKLFIIGTNSTSLIYATYYLLENYLGCKFLSSYFEYIPKQKNITLKKGIDIQSPRFEYREVFLHESDNTDFSLKRFLNGRLGHKANQNDKRFKNIYNIFEPYSLVKEDKYKCGGQLKFSNKDVQKLARESVEDIIKSNNISSHDRLYLQHQDVNSFCQSESPKAFFDYANFIAKSFKKNNFYVEAYQWSSVVPIDLAPLVPNLHIFFSTIESDFSKPLNKGTNKEYFKNLQNWTKKDSNIYIWHYISNFGGYFQPFPLLDSTAKNIKLFSTIKNIKGLFLQGAYDTSYSEFSNLKIWLFSHLLWNPNQDSDMLIEEFCKAYYGENSYKYIVKYITSLREINQKFGDKLLVKTTLNSRYIDDKYLDYYEKLLLDALKLADKKIYKDHVKEVLFSVDYVRAINGKSDSKRRVLEFIKRHKSIENYYEGGKIEDLKDFISLNRKNPSTPKKAEGLIKGVDWFDFQEYSLKLCCTKVKTDKKASDGVSATMRGDRSDWGLQLSLNDSLPFGKWDIYANVRVTLNRASLIDYAAPAFFFGIENTLHKGTRFVAQMKDEEYKTVKIGQVKIDGKKNFNIWLAPPDNKIVERLYLDRIFLIRHR